MAIVEAVDTEVAPIHEAVGEALDSLERVFEADVGCDDGFHGVDLVQLFGGDRLFDHLLQQQAEEREHEAHEEPGAQRPRDHRADENGRGEERRGVRDHLVAHDHQPFSRLELRADDEREVEEHAAEHEIRQRVPRKRWQELDAQNRRAVRHVEPAQ